jgi:hypothetical protein
VKVARTFVGNAALVLYQSLMLKEKPVKSVKVWLLLVAFGSLILVFAGNPSTMVAGPTNRCFEYDPNNPACTNGSSISVLKALYPLTKMPAPTSLEARARFHLEAAPQSR